MNRRTLGVLAAVVVIVGGGGFFAYRQLTATRTSSSTSTQTAQVERGTLASSVSAAGTMASPQTATLAWQATGTVGQVHVAVGEVVKAGDVLAELDASQASPAMLQAQADLLSAQEALATLMAGPTEEQLASARLAVIQAQEAVTTTQKSLNNVVSPSVAYYTQALADAQAGLDKAQAESTITDIGPGLASTVNNAQKAVDDALTRLYSVQAAEAGCGGCNPARLQASQENYQAAVNALTAAKLQMQVARQDNASSIQTAQNAVDQAQRNLAAVKASPDQSKVLLYQAQVDVAQAKLKQAQTDLATLQAGPDAQALAAAKAKVASTQAAVDAFRLTAPFAGTVVAVYNHTGDQVSPNQNAVELADLSSLQIEVNVAEVDVNSIALGQTADLTVDAAPNKTFHGTVTQVAYLGTSQQGVVNFPVTVVVTETDPALKPGMTAAVAIVTERHENVLLVPNRALRTSGGQRSVTVLFEGQQISVPVTVGLSNDSSSEILDGQLKEGDTVVVTAASTTTTTQNRTGGGAFFFGGGGGPP